MQANKQTWSSDRLSGKKLSLFGLHLQASLETWKKYLDKVVEGADGGHELGDEALYLRFYFDLH